MNVTVFSFSCSSFREVYRACTLQSCNFPPTEPCRKVHLPAYRYWLAHMMFLCTVCMWWWKIFKQCTQAGTGRRSCAMWSWSNWLLIDGGTISLYLCALIWSMTELMWAHTPEKVRLKQEAVSFLCRILPDPAAGSDTHTVPTPPVMWYRCLSVYRFKS